MNKKDAVSGQLKFLRQEMGRFFRRGFEAAEDQIFVTGDGTVPELKYITVNQFLRMLHALNTEGSLKERIFGWIDFAQDRVRGCLMSATETPIWSWDVSISNDVKIFSVLLTNEDLGCRVSLFESKVSPGKWNLSLIQKNSLSNPVEKCFAVLNDVQVIYTIQENLKSGFSQTPSLSDGITHWMVDLETFSTRPDALILQIGVVSSTGETLTLYPSYSQQMDAGRHISRDTLEWWLKQDKMPKGPDKTAFEVADELGKCFATLKKDDLVWCRGASFDFAILRHYLKSFGKHLPWSFRQERCQRTFEAMAQMFGYERPADHVVAHDALDDAKHQLAELGRMQEAIDFSLQAAQRLAREECGVS